MQRKLIQLSPSTAVVSLPSSWIKLNKLKKGAEIFLEEQENKLILSTFSQKSEKEITLDLTKLDNKLMWTSIDAAYVAGYDSIILITKNEEQKAFMTKVVRYFPGMIIYEESKSKVHFKSMPINQEEDLNKILSRIFNLNISMIEDSIEAIKNKNWEDLAKMKYRDYRINPYISYCLRHINKVGFTPFSKIGIICTYIKILEMMADKLCSLFVHIGNKKINADLEIINLILKIYTNARITHFKYSQQAVMDLENQRQNLKKLLEENPKTISYLNEISDLFYDMEELELQLNT